ncbi:MAG: RHS repeat-associated core domain-containing protein [Verrucomicrobiota bacterium]
MKRRWIGQRPGLSPLAVNPRGCLSRADIGLVRHTTIGAVVLLLAALQGTLGAALPGVDNDQPATTTLYVGPHFEVRNHDETVKYVLQAGSRVARITSSLSSNSRVQRLRLHSGWNLCSIAVGQSKWPNEVDIVSAFRWDPGAQIYAPLQAGQTLSSGAVVWVKATTNLVLPLVGSYAEPTQGEVKAGGAYVAGRGLEAWQLEVPDRVTIFRFDAANGRWRNTFLGELTAVGTPPPVLAPGEAVFVQTDRAVELTRPAPALAVAYYHGDHLGSASVITDSDGALVQESTYYPFGATRHEEKWQDLETHYGFTQKELDEESGLQDFGNRFYHPGLGRWLSPDPLGELGGGSNPYSYVNQNPIKHYDPDGAEIQVAKSVDRKTGTTTYQISLKAVFIDVSSKKFSQADVAKYAEKLKSTIEKSYSGQQGKTKWSTTVNLRVINDWSQVDKNDHVFRIVDRTSTGAAGNSELGGMLMDLAAKNYTKLTPDQVDHSNPANKHYTWENYTSPEGTGAHEFGHTAGLRHESGTGKPNLMQEGGERTFDNKDITRAQIETIWKASRTKGLNHRDTTMPSPSR